MSSTTIPWFVSERSEALAGLLLTSQQDVRVQKKYPHDDGVDFLVDINTGQAQSTRPFVVLVKGTTSSNPTDWEQVIQPFFNANDQQMYLPVCIFVVDVRNNNTAFYAWVAEPVVNPVGGILLFHSTPTFHRLDTAVTAEIVNRVKAWYNALHQAGMNA
jgi:Domain of unknown function (DUF4365)